MKITIKREPFAKSFALAARVAPTRSPQPILQYVLLVTSEKAATLVATNMEHSVRLANESVESVDPERLLLNVEKVGAFLQRSTADELTIERASQDGRILLKAGSHKIECLSPAVEEFPEVERVPPVGCTTCDAAAFSFALSAASICADDQSDRYALGGVLLDLENGAIVGTDGRRLTAFRIDFGGKSSGQQSIIPSHAVKLLIALIGDDPEATVSFVQSANRVSFYLPNDNYFDTRLVEGRFPKWVDVMSQSERADVTGSFLVGPMAAAIGTARIMTNKEEKGVRFNFDGAMATLSGSSKEVGDSDGRAGCDLSEPLEIKLDGEFFDQFLRTLDQSETVEIRASSSEGGFFCTARSGQYQHVIMPIGA